VSKAARLEPVRLLDDALAVRVIDQRELPEKFVVRDLQSIDEVIEAIRSLAVRGAPAIGLCAAAGLALAMRDETGQPRDAWIALCESNGEKLKAARPTAVNLAWAVDRCVRHVRGTSGDAHALQRALLAEIRRIRDEDLAMGEAIGAHGLTLLGGTPRVLTHCNTGALATAGAGTALAVVYAAHADGRDVRVFAAETRPLLQGARLTAWELQRAGIPVTVIADGAAAALMRENEVDAVLVGADCIAANGDVANKVGTYALAIAAAHHRIPFYVLAPWSTVDPATRDGQAIPIEMRSRDEFAFGGARVLPDGVPVWAPAFDVTPASLITAIVTDRGVHEPPYAFAA
jgi:methylthioribose-1-phosphate isomerase